MKNNKKLKNSVKIFKQYKQNVIKLNKMKMTI